MLGELGIVLPHLVEETLSVLATDKHLDRISERVIKAASLVADDVDDHRRERYRGQFRCLVQGKNDLGATSVRTVLAPNPSRLSAIMLAWQPRGVRA